MLLTLKINRRSKDAKSLFKYLWELPYMKIVDEKTAAFYAGFKKSVEESKALSEKKTKGKSLNALLNEL